jgi:hypothetical protein
VTQESRAVMACCLRNAKKYYILSNLTRVTMAIYERPVHDEFQTYSIDCWLQCNLSIHVHPILWFLPYVMLLFTVSLHGRPCGVSPLRGRDAVLSSICAETPNVPTDQPPIWPPLTKSKRGGCNQISRQRSTALHTR